MALNEDVVELRAAIFAKRESDATIRTLRDDSLELTFELCKTVGRALATLSTFPRDR